MSNEKTIAEFYKNIRHPTIEFPEKAMAEFYEDIRIAAIKIFDTLHGWRLRDKTLDLTTMTGNHSFFKADIDFHEFLQPNPFPKLSIDIWVNGKPSKENE